MHKNGFAAEALLRIPLRELTSFPRPPGFGERSGQGKGKGKEGEGKGRGGIGRRRSTLQTKILAMATHRHPAVTM